MRFFLGIALTGLIIGVAQAAPHSLEPEDLFRMQWATDPQIRPDGTQIVYARVANDIMTDRLVSSLWLIDIATGAQTPLAPGTGSNTSPRWSPDGSRIAYLSTSSDGRTQIAIRWMGGETANITNLTESPREISWSADGKQIAFVMLTPVSGPSIGKPLTKPPGATWGADPVVIDSMHFRADGQGMDKPGFMHIFVLSVEGGAPRQLTFGPFSDAGPLAWSADSKSILFAGNHSEDWRREPQDGSHTATTLSIYQVNLADGTSTQLSHEVGPYHAPRVSPDGKLVAYLGYEDKHVANQNVRLNLMDTDGKNHRVVGDSLDRSLTEIFWAGDGRSLYGEYVDHGITKVARIGLTGRIEPVVSEMSGIGAATQLPYSEGEFSVSNKGAVAFTGGGPDNLPEVYLKRDGKTQRLTNLNSELFAEVNIGKLAALPVKSSVDGRAIDAWELLPPNFDPSKKYPMILEIHGGPYASYGPTFSADYQLYASAGYIVVYGNPRGSTSYGEEFANIIYNNYPSQDYDDLMSVVDAAIQKGNVDADNLFVTGSSGGGVLTSWIVGKTHRFKAAVTQRPVINWTSWLLTSDMSAIGARYWFKKLPWDDQETFWKLSPLSLVGNVTTPTMVIVGLDDLRTTVAEAEQYYHALQLRHIPTELYELPGEPHVLQRPSHLAAQSNAILEWFGRYRSPAAH